MRGSCHIHQRVAVALEGWVESEDRSGAVWYQHTETGEITSVCPDVDRVAPYLERAGIRVSPAGLDGSSPQRQRQRAQAPRPAARPTFDVETAQLRATRSRVAPPEVAPRPNPRGGGSMERV